MRRSGIAFLIAAGLSFGLSAAALAADMAVKAPPLPVLFDWTGWYGGVNTGYSWGRSRATTDTPTAGAFTDSVLHRGWEASVEGGYCWQRRDGILVACIEARYDFPRERSGQATYPGIPVTSVVYTTHADPLLIGPHLGYLTDSNHTMLYLAGGVAVGEVGGGSTATNTAAAPLMATASPSDKTVAGWFAGAGIERMIDRNWSWKLEYDYVRFSGSGATAAYAGTFPPVGARLSSPVLLGSTASLGGNAYDNVMSVGINYHLH